MCSIYSIYCSVYSILNIWYWIFDFFYLIVDSSKYKLTKNYSQEKDSSFYVPSIVQSLTFSAWLDNRGSISHQYLISTGCLIGKQPEIKENGEYQININIMKPKNLLSCMYFKPNFNLVYIQGLIHYRKDNGHGLSPDLKFTTYSFVCQM